MKVLNLVRSSDFLGHSLNIRINRENGYKSFFGGLLSIIIILLSMLMIFYIGLEIFLKREPIVLNSKIQNTDFGPYNLTFKSEIQFFIGLEYSNFTYYIDNSIYTVSAEESTVEYIEAGNSTNQIITTRKLNLKKCSEIYSNTDLEEESLKIPLDLFVCVDPKEKAQIQGFWGNKVSKSVKVKLEKCQNRTDSNVTCKSKKEIDDYIQNGVLSIYTSDYLINQKNLNNPTKKYFRDVYNYLSANDGLIYVIAYSDFSFKSDTGFLFTNYVNVNFPMISDIKNSYSFEENKIFAFINFQGFRLAESYQRTYSKIQDILTKVGGLIKAMTLIGISINYIFSKPFFIINNILDNHNLYNLQEEGSINNILSKENLVVNKNNIFKSKIRNLNLKQYDYINDKNTKKSSNIKKFKNVFSPNINAIKAFDDLNNSNNVVSNLKDNNKNKDDGIIGFNKYSHNRDDGNFNNKVLNTNLNNSQNQIRLNNDQNDVIQIDRKLKDKKKNRASSHFSRINIDNLNSKSQNYYSIKKEIDRTSIGNKETSSFSKLNLFISYWCSKANKKYHKIFNYKEELIEKVLSLETINKIYFDVELLKLLNHNYKELRNMEIIYHNLFYDTEIYEKLRGYLYNKNTNTLSSDLSILGVFREEDNTFRRKLDYFEV